MIRLILVVVLIALSITFFFQNRQEEAVLHYFGATTPPTPISQPILTAFGTCLLITALLLFPACTKLRMPLRRTRTPLHLAEEALDRLRARPGPAVAPGSCGAGLAWLDLSTAEFRVLELKAPWADAARDELLRIEPREILVPDEEAERLRAIIGPTAAAITPVPASTFHPVAAQTLLLGHFRVASLAGFGCDDKSLAVSAAGSLLQYVNATQPGASLSHVTRMQVSAQGGTMLLDRATQRNLELVRRAVDGQVSGSLLSVLDRTVTPLGARLLREWILHPLTDLAQIAARQEAVADLHGNLDRRSRLRTALRGVSDLERLMSRIVLGVANARDLRALKDSIATVPAITRVLATCKAPLLRERAEAWDDLAQLAAKIEQAIHPEPPASRPSRARWR